MSLFADTRDPKMDVLDGVTRLFYRDIKMAYRLVLVIWHSKSRDWRHTGCVYVCYVVPPADVIAT